MYVIYIYIFMYRDRCIHICLYIYTHVVHKHIYIYVDMDIDTRYDTHPHICAFGAGKYARTYARRKACYARVTEALSWGFLCM